MRKFTAASLLVGVVVIVVLMVGRSVVGAASQAAQLSFLVRYPQSGGNALSIVCSVGADGGGSFVRSVRPAGPFVGFSWDPYGSRIAIVSRDRKRLLLETMSADGTGRRRIIEVPELPPPAQGIEPAWSPDGRLLAFDAAGSLLCRGRMDRSASCSCAAMTRSPVR